MSNINTNQPFKDKSLRKPRILVAPLDWGLGHATRCIPVIRELLKQEAEVWIAGEGSQKELLSGEFPALSFLPLPGYRVKYAQSGLGLLFNMLRQTRQILSAIKNENSWLKEMITTHGFDVVISDNRYGLRGNNIHTIFITHQLAIKSPLGKWTEKILQRKNYKYINHFNECWVPDINDAEDSLAGALSHPKIKPAIPVSYIGPLSRFELTGEPIKNNHLLVILSGPEPQRTVLEEKIIKDIAHYPFTATIVRGLPGSESIIPSTGMIQFYNHLPADALNKEMEQAAYVISRSGYSTIMDLMKLKKKSILIPTPGQTEQEYLGDYLSKKQWLLCVAQKDFSLTDSLKKAEQFSYRFPSMSAKQDLEQAVSGLLEKCMK